MFHLSKKDKGWERDWNRAWKLLDRDMHHRLKVHGWTDKLFWNTLEPACRTRHIVSYACTLRTRYVSERVAGVSGSWVVPRIFRPRKALCFSGAFFLCLDSNAENTAAVLTALESKLEETP